jgi:hypothetical protein
MNPPDMLKRSEEQETFPTPFLKEIKRFKNKLNRENKKREFFLDVL